MPDNSTGEINPEDSPPSITRETRKRNGSSISTLSKAGKLSAAAICLDGTLITLLAWQYLSQQEQNLLQSQVKIETEYIAKLVKHDLESRLLALRRVTNRWETGNGTPKMLWMQDASNYYHDYQGYHAIYWIDSTYRIRWEMPQHITDADQTEFNSQQAEVHMAEMLRARNLNLSTFGAPFELAHGKSAFRVYCPIFIDQEFHGFTVGVFVNSEWLTSVLPADITSRFVVQLRREESIMAEFAQPQIQYNPNFAGTAPIELANVKWNIHIKPSEQFVQSEMSDIPGLVLGFGLGFSFLLGLSFYGMAKAMEAGRRLREFNSRLEHTVNERTAALQRAHDTLEDKVELRTAQLQASERHIRQMTEDVPDYAILRMDAAGTIENWNLGAQRIMGCTPQEVVGKHFRLFFYAGGLSGEQTRKICWMVPTATDACRPNAG